MTELVAAIRNHPLLATRPALRQFIKFGLVGASNTVVDFTIYIGFTRLVPFFFDHKLIANGISFVGGVTNSFTWNKLWTFRNRERRVVIQYPKFFMVSVVALGFNQTIFWLLHTHAGIHDLIAKSAAVVIVVFWNFTMHKFWTFRVRSIPRGHTSPLEADQR